MNRFCIQLAALLVATLASYVVAEDGAEETSTSEPTFNLAIQSAYFDVESDMNALPDEVGVELDRVADFLKKHTGLAVVSEGDARIRVRVLSVERYRQLMRERINDDRSELERQLRVFAGLGMFDQQDAEDVLHEMLESESLGYFDRREGVLTLRFHDGLDVETAAHEMVHLMQHVHVGLDKLHDGDGSWSDDRKQAATAVVEGLAELSAECLKEYVDSGNAIPDAQALQRIRFEARRRVSRLYSFPKPPSSGEAAMRVAADARQVVAADVAFPYSFGLLYCAEKALAALDDGVSFHDWYAQSLDPGKLPQSTEEIIDGAQAWGEHPCRVPSIEGVAELAKDNGCEILEDGVLGDLLCRLWLGFPVFNRDASLGWSGDRLILLVPKDSDVPFGVLVVAFDSEEAARRTADWLELRSHVAFFAGQSVRRAERKGQVVYFEIGDAPEWFSDNAVPRLSAFVPPPARLSLRRLDSILDAWISLESGETADAFLPLSELPHLDPKRAADRIGRLVFEVSPNTVPRTDRLHGLLRVGGELANLHGRIPSAMDAALRDIAFQAACKADSPAGLVNSLRYLNASGLPKDPSAYQELLEASQGWPTAAAGLAASMRKRWGPAEGVSQ